MSLANAGSAGSAGPPGPIGQTGGLDDRLVRAGRLPAHRRRADRIRVLSDLEHPWQSYEYLTRVSQIPRTERIRSDSASRPDNIWGSPSYAIEEAWREKSLRAAIQVFLEPMWRDFYTPRAGQVFTHLEREAERVRYREMLVKGQVRMIRRRVGGGYFTVLTPTAGRRRDQTGRVPLAVRPLRGWLPPG